MSTTADDKTMEKIKAILRKAEEGNNPSEEERDTAMRMANKLLLKHGLSMADVGDLSSDEQSYEHEGFFAYEGDHNAWKASLLHVVARVYFCQAYRIPLSKNAGRMMLVGATRNAQTAKMMYGFIEPQIQNEFDKLGSQMGLYWRIARRYAIVAAQADGLTEEEVGYLEPEELAVFGSSRLEGLPNRTARIADVRVCCQLNSNGYAVNALPRIKAHDIAPYEPEHVGVWRRSFMDAAIKRIQSRLRATMREEVKDLGEPGTELVRNEKANLDQLLSDLNLGLRGGSSSRGTDEEGAAAGRAAGDRADISGHKKVTNIGRRQIGS